MAEQEEIIKTCDECGAAIYPDHLEKGTAGMVNEKLLCPICYREYNKHNIGAHDDADQTIALVDEEADLAAETRDEPKPKIKAFGDDSVFGHMVDHNESKWKRPTNNTGRGAVRCRTFHTKLSDAALSYMDSLIAEWTEKNPQIDIKFATSAIGIYEGKRAEPHLIVTVFY
jgi:hypothetical protein